MWYLMQQSKRFEKSPYNMHNWGRNKPPGIVSAKYFFSVSISINVPFGVDVKINYSSLVKDSIVHARNQILWGHVGQNHFASTHEHNCLWESVSIGAKIAPIYTTKVSNLATLSCCLPFESLHSSLAVNTPEAAIVSLQMTSLKGFRG